MSSNLVSNSLTLKQAVYIGKDADLTEAVTVSIRSKYTLESMSEVPQIWPDEVALVLVEYDGDVEHSINQINQVLTTSKGIAVYVLLKEKDSDYLIEASHQGVQGFIECPDEVFNILSILHMQDRRRIGKNGNVSSFFSLKGGVGTTSLATNVAYHISELTRGRTVLVDLNMPLGDTALYLNMEGKRLYSLTDFIYNINRFDEKLLYSSLSRHESGLYLLPLPLEVSELDSLSGDLIKSIIESLRRYFDHVVIDCASNLSDITLSSLDESDNIVLVAEPSLSSLRAVNTAIQLSQKLGYVRDSLKLVVNRSNSSDDRIMEEVIDSLEVDMVLKVDNDYINFNESLKEGQLLSFYKPTSTVNQQLFSLGHLLHNGGVRPETKGFPIAKVKEAPSSIFTSVFEKLVARFSQAKSSSKV